MGAIQNAIDNVAMKALAATVVKDQKKSQDLQQLSQLTTQKDVLTKEQQDLENEDIELAGDKNINKQQLKDADMRIRGAENLKRKKEEYLDNLPDNTDPKKWLGAFEGVMQAQRDLEIAKATQEAVNMQRNNINRQLRQVQARREALQGRTGAFNQQAESFNKKQRIGTTIEPIGGKK